MKYCHFNLELNCRFSDKVFTEMEKSPKAIYAVALKTILSKYMDSKYFSFDSMTKGEVTYIKGADYISAMALQGYKFESLDDDVNIIDGPTIFWWSYGRLYKGETWKYDQTRQVYLRVEYHHRILFYSSLEDQYKLKVRGICE